MTRPVPPIPPGRPALSPYLIVEDARELMAFLESALGAVPLTSSEDSHGRIIHAELRLGDSVVMLGQSNEEFPPLRSMMHLYVEDVDALFRQAVAAGGRPVREPETMFYGDRSGGFEDPAGNQWWLASRVEEVDPDELARREARMAAGGSHG